MKIAISSNGQDLESFIDPRFGRCSYFIIMETDDMSFEAFDNESMGQSGGAGIQSAQFVASKGTRAVITGNVGPNAVKTLTAAGINIFLGQQGPIRKVIENFKAGELNASASPNVSDHSGMKTVPGIGDGMGMGRGMGMGQGMGMGRGMGRGGGCRNMSGGKGMGRGMGASNYGNPDMPSPANFSEKEELANLKNQAMELTKRIEAIESGGKNKS